MENDLEKYFLDSILKNTTPNSVKVTTVFGSQSSKEQMLRVGF